MGTEIVKTDFTPQLEESRTLITKAGDLLAAQLISGLTRLEADAQDCELVFKRFPAEVTEKTLERAADFKKAVANARTAADKTRKALTGPLDDLKKIIKGLFDGGILELEEIERQVQQRLDAYYAKVDEARKAADAAAATGGTVTAEQTQALVAPLKATTDHGTGVTSQRRVSGELADIKTFLSWMLDTGSDEELALIAAKIPKSMLNTFAVGADAEGVTPEDFQNNTGIKLVVEKKALVR